MNLDSYRPSTGLVKLLCFLLGASAMLRLVGAGSGWLDVELLGKHSSFDQISDAELITAGVRALLVFGATALLSIVTAIVFCVWVVRAAKNARALGAQGMTVSPGWCAGWFFVPIANLFMPFKGVSEIYKASEPGVKPPNPEGWMGVPLPGLLVAWWALWVMSLLINNASFTLGSDQSMDTLVTSAWMTIVGQTISMVAAFCAMGVVRVIHDRQQERAQMLAQDPAFSQPSDGPSSFLPHAPAA